MATAETLFTVCLPAGLKLYHTSLILGFSLGALPDFFPSSSPQEVDLYRLYQQVSLPSGFQAGPTSRHQGDEERGVGVSSQNPLPGHHRSAVSLYQSPSSCQATLSSQLTLPRGAETAPSPSLQGRRGDGHSSLKFPYTLPMPLSTTLSSSLSLHLFAVGTMANQGDLYYLKCCT